MRSIMYSKSLSFYFGFLFLSLPSFAALEFGGGGGDLEEYYSAGGIGGGLGGSGYLSGESSATVYWNQPRDNSWAMVREQDEEDDQLHKVYRSAVILCKLFDRELEMQMPKRSPKILVLNLRAFDYLPKAEKRDLNLKLFNLLKEAIEIKKLLLADPEYTHNPTNLYLREEYRPLDYDWYWLSDRSSKSPFVKGQPDQQLGNVYFAAINLYRVLEKQSKGQIPSLESRISLKGFMTYNNLPKSEKRELNAQLLDLLKEVLDPKN